MKTKIQNFLDQESSGGIILMVMVVIAMVLANSPLAPWYEAFLDTPAQVRAGALNIDKPLLLWINDGLMALFFTLIGLEVKRELLQGALSTPSKAALPTYAALGGLIVPALIFLAFNHADPLARTGWAIPAATDIAFALGILALLGSRVPVELKVFLLALAIIDDLLVILIIALFYSDALSMVSLAVSALATGVLVLMNRLGVRRLSPFLLVGIVLWVAVLKSGVHATLAGVVLAFVLPLKKDAKGYCASEHLEHRLHPWSTFLILPVFAFANAGVNLSGLGMGDLTSPLPMGIALGLLLGKPIGIMLFSGAAVLLRIAKLPEGLNWVHLLGVSLLCGVGFTMAMFVGSLSFDAEASDYADLARLGILIGSALAALLGCLLLKATLPEPDADASASSGV
ncbi:Na+/H+ antiporter NhaA [Ferrimonas balearica]|uniref:Na+/H+ antiporter NhaA n=1 Tax=Ferrimonas balearica TaxID=44012 RepID=UPI001C999C4E|nr:Na+/H+ antiporter NhaA [Ferrimonas balearica]MBY5991778.1 Na+/H+ antiporter NhaA [Ferrimonas balearica]